MPQIDPAPKRSQRAPCLHKLVLMLVALAMLALLSSPAGAQATAPQSETVRDSGLTVRVFDQDIVTIHTLTSPVDFFANTTYLIETENSLVAVDAQFLLPMAADMRAYADELGKPIDRMFITHEHPDHFLGGEAFADVRMYALGEVSNRIAEIGQAEVDEKQADFGPDFIASSFVVPEAVEPGTIEIDGITLELEKYLDAEAPVQLVVKIPGSGAIITGDIVYSGVHLIMAGQPETWIPVLEQLAATAEEYPLVLPGHGDPTDPSEYEVNIAWLNTAAELTTTAQSADEFKQGLIDAFPGRPMEAAIDFVTPFLFPAEVEAAQDEPAEELPMTGSNATPLLVIVGATLVASGALFVQRSRKL